MIQKIIGTAQIVIGIILVAVGGFFVIVLFTGGGPILPHIVGPIVLLLIGVVLLALRRKTT